MSYANGVGALQQMLSSITPATTQATESTNASDQRGVRVASPSSANHTDQTSLSSVGGMIAHALEGSDVRSDKVAALQQAIASGTYHVSSSDVADKVVQSLLE
jgi:negative regulator of flagellin synthesis FlgM